MLRTLKEIMEQTFGGDGDGDANGDRLKSVELAGAVLMLEISLADSDSDAVERDTIRNLLLTHFNQTEETVDELVGAAEREVEAAVSLHEFTRLLNERLSRAEKRQLIEVLWRVAFADTVIDKYEEYYLRKITDLLHVSHADYMKAKHRVAEAS